MPLLDTTYAYQSGLAAYCRTGSLPAIPGINANNIIQYRRLVYNVVADMLQNAYPLTYALLSSEEWGNVVNEFFINHPCQSPQVWYMPKEFHQYLSDARHPLLKKYPFLADLLWFEWVEVELFMMEDKTARAGNSGDVLFSKLVLNPEHQLLLFTYPVHEKNAKYITPADKGSYYVIAHRNKEGEIIFTSIAPALARMIEYLSAAPLSITNLFNMFQQEYQLSLTEGDQKAIIQFFTNAYQQQLIIGFLIF
jgi:hypothetical protein